MVNIDWKHRAISRRLENKMLKKRCKELITSRDKWKEKSIGHKLELDKAKKQMADIKKNIEKILNV